MGRIMSAFKYALTTKPNLELWRGRNILGMVRYDVGSMILPRKVSIITMVLMFAPLLTMVVLPFWFSFPLVMAVWFVDWRAFIKISQQYADENYEIIIRKKLDQP